MKGGNFKHTIEIDAHIKSSSLELQLTWHSIVPALDHNIFQKMVCRLSVLPSQESFLRNAIMQHRLSSASLCSNGWPSISSLHLLHHCTCSMWCWALDPGIHVGWVHYQPNSTDRLAHFRNSYLRDLSTWFW